MNHPLLFNVESDWSRILWLLIKLGADRLTCKGLTKDMGLATNLSSHLSSLVLFTSTSSNRRWCPIQYRLHDLFQICGTLSYSRQRTVHKPDRVYRRTRLESSRRPYIHSFVASSTPPAKLSSVVVYLYTWPGTQNWTISQHILMFYN